MTTECPVRIRGNTERWPVLNQSTSYRSSSSQMSIEDLGLFLNDRRFRGPEKDVIPNRSESAPPSMEGSMTAIGNIFSFQRSALAPGSIRPSIFAINLETGQDSHANSADGFSRLPIKNLPSHEEESEDDQSSDQSCSISGEKFTTLGHHSMPLNSKQEDSFHSSSLSHDHYNSFSYKSSERAVVSDENCNTFHNIPISMQSSGSITPCSGNMSQISSLDSSGDQADWPCRNEEDLNTVKVDERDNHTGDPSNVYGAHGKAVKSGGEFTASSSQSSKLHMKEQSKCGNNLLQQQAQESSPQNQGSYPQIVYSGPPNDYGGLKRFHNASSSVSATESQPVLNASGYTPPMYASTAAFMASPTAFYPGLRPSGFIAPQYGIGRYNLNSAVIPSYIAGYPHRSIVPMALDGASFLTSGVPNGANIHAYDQQNLFKFYGQVGVHMQPPYGMHYFHPMIQNAYGLYDRIDGATVKVMNSFSSVRGSTPVALSNDYKSQHSAGPSYSNLNLKIGNTPSHYNFGNPTDTASLGQFPAALAKPVTGINFPGTRYTVSRSRTSDGSPSTPNEHNRTWNDLNSYSFLEDLKSGKGQRFELSDIAGHIVEFSIDQHGSRFIQQKLEICTVEEKASVLKEVVPHASKLMTDVFGNYVIQKLLEYGSPDQRKYLTSQLEGQILSLSLQMYGCRVIQKALEVVDLEQKTYLVRELDGHIMRCVRDQNGNHVIQKCIETFPTENIHFIISCFRGQVAALSMHPYGCRVVQRILEHCSNNQQTQFIVEEILDSVCSLAQDQYGNYVTQHVLVRGNPQERNEIIEKLTASIVQLSQHKFASNVIEKCIEYSNPTTRDMLIKNIIDHGDMNDNLLIMMKDQYANYVVQKILDKCSIEQRELLLGVIRSHITILKKYTYGKHIVSRFERLSVEDIKTQRITG